MRCLWLNTQSPSFNLATEEYLLKQTSDDVFMLWQNRDSVIVGRHQNTLAEIDTDFVGREKITVVRRLTGGGAVFHDLGNLNFTFIQNIQPQEKEINFLRYLQPIVDALQALGVPAAFSGRNDLVIDGKKISGNAMTFHGNRALEHGTLLFSTIQSKLMGALKADPLKFQDKAVKSVRSRVTNISEHLPRPMDVLAFKDYLMQFVMQSFGAVEPDTLTPEEEVAIRELERTRYGTWEWNFGISPQYTLTKKIKTSGGILEAMTDVQNGRIRDVRFFGDFFSTKEPEELANLLIGQPHNRGLLADVLGTVSVSDYFNGVSAAELLSLLI
jgi:lipoate-protein ligase A